MSAGSGDPTREALAAENARLTRLLEEARAEAASARLRSPQNDADHLEGLAGSRMQAADYLRHVREMREAAGAARSGVETDDGRTGPSELGDLLGELRAAHANARATEERLALVFEASGSIGWWDWDVPSDRLYANSSFARMFGVDPAEAARGVPLETFVEGIHPDDREPTGRRIMEVLESGGEFSEEYRLLQRHGAVVWIHAHGRCYLDANGQPLRFPGVAIDITSRKESDLRKSALLELGDRLREAESIERIAYTAAEVIARTLRATRAGIGTVDQLSETVMMQPDWQAPGIASIAGLHRFRDYGSFIEDLKRGEAVIIGDVTTDPRTAASADILLAIGIRVLVNLPIIEHGQLVSVVFVHHNRPHDWIPQELNFLKTVGDRTQAAIGRVRAEEQQRLLNRELGHRLKNNLAMVQAIAAQTLRNAPDLETARSSLSNRLMALGRAHELLLSGSIDSTDMRTVTEGTLALHDDGEGRISLAGPPVHIGSMAALSLALVLHELATNAAKYGALSTPEGRVSIEWSLKGKAGDENLVFNWTERGGPQVSRPDHRGFGSRLIERGLAGSIGGEVTLDYRAEGLACRLVAPLTGLQRET